MLQLKKCKNKLNCLFILLFASNALYAQSYEDSNSNVRTNIDTVKYYKDICDIITEFPSFRLLDSGYKMTETQGYYLRDSCVDLKIPLTNKEYFLYKCNNSGLKKFEVYFVANNTYCINDLYSINKIKLESKFLNCYVSYMKKFKFFGKDCIYGSFGSRSYNNSFIGEYTPILIIYNDSSFILFILDGFIYDEKCNMPILKYNNQIIFISVDYYNQSVVLNKMDSNFTIYSKKIKLSTLVYNAKDNRFLVGEKDFLLIKEELKNIFLKRGYELLNKNNNYYR
jgi:hypothetical protein